MGDAQSFQQFLANTTSEIDVIAFCINMILTAIIIHIVAYVYIHYASAVSNRKVFSRNLILISITTMLIITIVKSSLALSLGLVGALSIVRFRTPIKEPEELAYLFLSIAIGLGFGAGQRLTTIIGALFILAIALLLKKRKDKSLAGSDIYLSVSSDKVTPDLMDKIMEAFKQNECKVDLKRVDEDKSLFRADFVISLDDYEKLNNIKKSILSLDNEIKISLIDNRLLY